MPRPALSFSVCLLATAGCAHPAHPPSRISAPDSFLVAFATSKGPINVMVHRAWAPRGADHIYMLLRQRFYDDARFFRVVPHYVAQVGYPADPRAMTHALETPIDDDSVRVSNTRGRVSMASFGPRGRTTHLFFNLRDNVRLDTLRGGFPPVGEVVAGLAVADSLNGEYGGDLDQDSTRQLGNRYLLRLYPRLDYIRTARIVREY